MLHWPLLGRLQSEWSSASVKSGSFLPRRPCLYITINFTRASMNSQLPKPASSTASCSIASCSVAQHTINSGCPSLDSVTVRNNRPNYAQLKQHSAPGSASGATQPLLETAGWFIVAVVPTVPFYGLELLTSWYLMTLTTHSHMYDDHNPSPSMQRLLPSNPVW